MDTKMYLQLLRRHWAVVVLLTLLGTAVGVMVGRLQDPMYAARTQLVVSPTHTSNDSSDAYQGSLLARNNAQSYTKVVTGSGLARSLITDLHLPYSAGELRSRISATNPKETAVIDVTVTDRSQERAKLIAERIGPLFADVVTTLQTTPANAATTDPGGIRRGDVEVSVLEPAERGGQVSPNKVLDTALGFVAGLALGMGVAVLREVTDTRIRGGADLRGITRVPLLAVVPADATARRPMPLPGARRSWPAVAAFRRLSVNLPLGTSGPHARLLAVTAPTAGKGAAATSVGLAIALAEGGETVAVVDTDLRNPWLGEFLGLSAHVGIEDVLAGRFPLDRALQLVQKGLPLLALVSTAPGPDLDRAPLRRDQLAVLCEELSRRADVVIFVGPPALQDADSVTLARVVGHVVIVAEAKTTRREELQQCELCLEGAGATIVGTVLSGVNGRNGHLSVVPAERQQSHAPSRGPEEHRTPRSAPDGEPAHKAGQLRK